MQTFDIFGFDFTPVQLTVIVLAAFVAGVSKSGIVGVGVVITPIMAGMFSAGMSLGFMVPLYLVGDITAIARRGSRNEVNWRPLLKALPWGIAGTLAGWRLAAFLGRNYGPESDVYLRKVMGFLMLTMVLVSEYVSRHPEVAMRKGSATGRGGVKTWYASILGAFAGMVSMLVNGAGAIWALYFSSLGLEVREVVSTSVWCFFAISLTKIPLSANLGFLDWNTLGFNLLLAPVTILGVHLGYRLSGRFSKKTFYGITRTLALIGALYMLIF